MVLPKSLLLSGTKAYTFGEISFQTNKIKKMKLFSTLLLTGAMAATLFSCSKDEEPLTYKKSDFMGSWELSSSTDVDSNLCDSKNDILIIGEATFTETSFSQECTGQGSAEYDYTFDGKDKLVIMGGFATYKITKASASEIKFEATSPLTTETILLTYTK